MYILNLYEFYNVNYDRVSKYIQTYNIMYITVRITTDYVCLKCATYVCTYVCT